MSQKLSRRQMLKLLTLATGGAAISSTCLNSLSKSLAQSGEDSFNYLPIVTKAESTPTSAPTIAATPPSGTPPIPTAAATPLITPAPGVFVDGPGGNVNTAMDLLVSSSWPTRNGGRHRSFELAGGPGTFQHGLIKFDLSALPPSYTCVRARLYLYHNYEPEGNGDYTNSGTVYSVSAANWPWIEGTGNIEIARPGEPCWNARGANGNEGMQTPWAGSAGCSTLGVDYESTPMGTWSFNGGSPKGHEIVIELDTSRVQGWFGSPNTNYGIILVTDLTPPAHVGTSEESTAEYHPKLVVDYA